MLNEGEVFQKCETHVQTMKNEFASQCWVTYFVPSQVSSFYASTIPILILRLRFLHVRYYLPTIHHARSCIGWWSSTCRIGPEVSV